MHKLFSCKEIKKINGVYIGLKKLLKYQLQDLMLFFLLAVNQLTASPEVRENFCD